MQRTSRKRPNESDGFTCIKCKNHISGYASGTQHRNHCPLCLWSRHLDEHPGDRRSVCRSSMQPIAIEVRDNGEWAIVHRCTGCNVLRANRIAGDDHILTLLALALRPMAQPAFPLDYFGQ
ncbi:MAG: RNHCP domain-containing protein [Phycisphaeraceae bacterium]|nr:RNHCP domain-containing protein [Phycisphaerales bacterium]MCB9860913.1 RNHCP domain-containing protein [Phycisphaeraceae bacterium]